MSAITCCWFWLILGMLLGWLLNRLLCKCCCKTKNTEQTTEQSIDEQASPLMDTPPESTAPPKENITSNSQSTVVGQPEQIETETTATASSNDNVEQILELDADTVDDNTVNTVAASNYMPAETAAIALDLAAAKTAGFRLKGDDDFTAIEGIGPKISSLFQDAGIANFAQFATQSIADMQAVLDKGGSRYRIANPETWAQQAALAAENKWAALKQLQDELSGGRKK